MHEYMHHVFKLKNNPMNNCYFNIDQNNRDYDFFHNLAALDSMFINVAMFVEFNSIKLYL